MSKSDRRDSGTEETKFSPSAAKGEALLRWQRPTLTRIDVKRTMVCCGSNPC